MVMDTILVCHCVDSDPEIEKDAVLLDSFDLSSYGSELRKR